MKTHTSLQEKLTLDGYVLENAHFLCENAHAYWKPHTGLTETHAKVELAPVFLRFVD